MDYNFGIMRDSFPERGCLRRVLLLSLFVALVVRGAAKRLQTQHVPKHYCDTVVLPFVNLDTTPEELLKRVIIAPLASKQREMGWKLEQQKMKGDLLALRSRVLTQVSYISYNTYYI